MYLKLASFNPNLPSAFPGKKCAVVYFGECNFRCPYCFIPKHYLEGKGCKSVNINQVLALIFQTKPEAVEFTGGEPTMQKRPLIAMASFLKSQGILVKVHTNGTNPGVVGDLLTKKIVDYLCIDIKAPFSDEALWNKVTGINARDYINKVNESTDIAKDKADFFEVVYPVIPGLNDKAEYIRKVCNELIFCHSFVVRAFENKYGTVDPAFSKKKPPSFDTLKKLARTARDTLLNVESVRIQQGHKITEI
ncbi:MAG: radical SAM protein [Candidatus Diapherotrites archaeon]|nr:radical SAM protein [Candidatus Diapherotrites archaeon]